MQTIEKGILRHHVGNCSVSVCAFKTNKIKGIYSPADPGVCEMLLSGARTEVRRRARNATFEEHEVDPQLIIKSDVENVMKAEFK